MVEDPTDLLTYITWFKTREPLFMDIIEECVAVLNQEKDSLKTLKDIFEAKIT
jgi:hypothetical protein